jgi:RecQ-mediated genome instability protein 1
VLVQIVAITDTGVSAYQLEQVRAAREEHILSGSGDKEGEEDGDVDIEGEGPMPKYPRGSLRLRLSDGVTKLEAMEYRPLPQISLGPTPLGYKLQLKGTLIRNGMAFLEPSTVVFLGGAQDQLESRQHEYFKRGLRVRLG